MFPLEIRWISGYKFINLLQVYNAKHNMEIWIHK